MYLLIYIYLNISLYPSIYLFIYLHLSIYRVAPTKLSPSCYPPPSLSVAERTRAEKSLLEARRLTLYLSINIYLSIYLYISISPSPSIHLYISIYRVSPPNLSSSLLPPTFLFCRNLYISIYLYIYISIYLYLYIHLSMSIYILAISWLTPPHLFFLSQEGREQRGRCVGRGG